MSNKLNLTGTSILIGIGIAISVVAVCRFFGGTLPTPSLFFGALCGAIAAFLYNKMLSRRRGPDDAPAPELKATTGVIHLNDADLLTHIGPDVPPNREAAADVIAKKVMEHVGADLVTVVKRALDDQDTDHFFVIGVTVHSNLGTSKGLVLRKLVDKMYDLLTNDARASLTPASATPQRGAAPIFPTMAPGGEQSSLEGQIADRARQLKTQAAGIIRFLLDFTARKPADIWVSTSLALNVASASHMHGRLRIADDEEPNSPKLLQLSKRYDLTRAKQANATRTANANDVYLFEQISVDLLPLTSDSTVIARHPGQVGLRHIELTTLHPSEALTLEMNNLEQFRRLRIDATQYDTPTRIIGLRTVSLKGSIEIIGWITPGVSAGTGNFEAVSPRQFEQLDRRLVMVLGVNDVMGQSNQSKLFDEWVAQNQNLVRRWEDAKPIFVLSYDRKRQLWHIRPEKGVTNCIIKIAPDRGDPATLWKDPGSQIYRPLPPDGGHIITPVSCCHIAINRTFNPGHWLILRIDVGSRTDADTTDPAGAVEPSAETESPGAEAAFDVGALMLPGLHRYIESKNLVDTGEEISSTQGPIFLVYSSSEPQDHFFVKMAEPKHAEEYKTEAICKTLLKSGVLPRSEITIDKINYNGTASPDGQYLVLTSRRMTSLTEVLDSADTPAALLGLMMLVTEFIAMVVRGGVICVDMDVDNFVMHGSGSDMKPICIDYGAYILAADLKTKYERLVRRQHFPLPEAAMYIYCQKQQKVGFGQDGWYHTAEAMQSYLLGLLLAQILAKQSGYAPAIIEQPVAGLADWEGGQPDGSSFYDLEEVRDVAQANFNGLKSALQMRFGPVLKNDILLKGVVEVLLGLLRFDPRERISVSSAAGQLAKLYSMAIEAGGLED